MTRTGSDWNRQRATQASWRTGSLVTPDHEARVLADLAGLDDEYFQPRPRAVVRAAKRLNESRTAAVSAAWPCSRPWPSGVSDFVRQPPPRQRIVTRAPTGACTVRSLILAPLPVIAAGDPARPGTGCMRTVGERAHRHRLGSDARAAGGVGDAQAHDVGAGRRERRREHRVAGSERSCSARAPRRSR